MSLLSKLDLVQPQWNNRPCCTSGRKNCGRVCGQWRGNLLKASSLHAEDCKLFTGRWTIESIRAIRARPGQSRTLATCHGTRICHQQPILDIFVTSSHITIHSRKPRQRKNWDERQLLCVAGSLSRIWSTHIYIAYLKGGDDTYDESISFLKLKMSQFKE